MRILSYRIRGRTLLIALLISILIAWTHISHVRERAQKLRTRLIRSAALSDHVKAAYTTRIHPSKLPKVSNDLQSKLHSVRSKWKIAKKRSLADLAEMMPIAENLSREFENGTYQMNASEAHPAYNVGAFQTLGFYAKLHSMLHSLLYSPLQSKRVPLDELYEDIDKLKKLISQLEWTIYPFLKTPLELIPVQGRGIVLTGGSKHFNFAIQMLTNLRNILNCTLPVEVFVNGQEDFKPTQIIALQKFKDVKVIDINSRLDVTDLEGWAIKPFAILASRFQEVIYMDVDVLILKDPAVLFSDPEYKRLGTLFYRDRSFSMAPKDPTGFTRKLLLYPSEEAKETRMWKHPIYGGHEMEAGIVVYNKRSENLYALALVTRLQMTQEREEMYKYYLGDKESFWIAHELLELPYNFSPTYAQNIGFVSNGYVCGSPCHVDRDDNLLWWNNGVLLNKMESLDGILRFELYSRDVASMPVSPYAGFEGAWCVYAAENERFAIKEKDKKMIETYISIWKDIRVHEMNKTLEMNADRLYTL